MNIKQLNFFKHRSLHKILPNIFILTETSSGSIYVFFLTQGTTLAVVKGPEDYHTLSDDLKNVIDAVNTPIHDGYVAVNFWFQLIL